MSVEAFLDTHRPGTSEAGLEFQSSPGKGRQAEERAIAVVDDKVIGTPEPERTSGEIELGGAPGIAPVDWPSSVFTARRRLILEFRQQVQLDEPRFYPELATHTAWPDVHTSHHAHVWLQPRTAAEITASASMLPSRSPFSKSPSINAI
jgi:hypothetical protein